MEEPQSKSIAPARASHRLLSCHLANQKAAVATRVKRTIRSPCASMATILGMNAAETIRKAVADVA
ncbi:MAG: hypothetical protein ACKOWD_14910, partial [Rhodoferax sp.]